MTEMIDRVARAIREGRRCGTPDEPLTVPCPFCEWAPDANSGTWDETGCIWLAREAIVAMREPTAEMLAAARDWSATKHGKPVGNDDAAGWFQSMIDAAAAQ
jgi:hypothetical protein